MFEFTVSENVGQNSDEFISKVKFIVAPLALKRRGKLTSFLSTL
jgi:hypothetical protein